MVAKKCESPRPAPEHPHILGQGGSDRPRVELKEASSSV